MTRYELPEQIDHVDSTKPLIDDTVIKGSYKIVASVEERNLIPILKRSLHSLVTIVGDVIKEFIGATTDDTDWLEDSNWRPFTVLPGVVYIDDGQSITIKDADTGATMAEIDRNGQFKSYGRQLVANGSFNTYTYDGKIRIEQNTLNGNFYLKMYDSSDVLRVHVDTAGISSFFGLKSNTIELDSTATFTDQQKADMPIGTSFWNADEDCVTVKNGDEDFVDIKKNTASNTVFTPTAEITSTNAQSAIEEVLSLGGKDNGIPNPSAFTYTNNVLTKSIEDLGDTFTIEKRYRYYPAESAQYGSIDIMETKNTKANLWVRTTYSYTDGLLTSTSNATITDWSI